MKSFTRRAWLKLTALTVGAPLVGAQAKHLEPATQAKRRSIGGSNGFAGTVRDRLWSSVATGELAMTPAESALYLGVPNVILTGSANGQSLGRQLALSLSGFTRVVWPTDGKQHFIGAVRPLLASFPNFTGVLLDCTRDAMLIELSPVRDAIGHKDLWASISSESLNLWTDCEPLQSASVVIVWPESNEGLEPLLARVEKQLPATDIMLGCSLQDDSDPQSKSRIHTQCEFALKAIHDKRVAGLVFGTDTGISGGSEAVTHTQEWIAKVRGQRV